MKIKVTDHTESKELDLQPICPQCKAEYDTINMKQVDGTFGKRYVYYCVHCRATLGITHRKGFWMG